MIDTHVVWLVRSMNNNELLAIQIKWRVIKPIGGEIVWLETESRVKERRKRGEMIKEG